LAVRTECKGEYSVKYGHARLLGVATCILPVPFEPLFLGNDLEWDHR
jgi:hypothetical protein